MAKNKVFPKGEKIKGTRLTPMGIVFDKRGRWMYECQCDCGEKTNTYHPELVSGRKKSCGCFGLEQRIKAHTTHGISKRPEYYVAFGAWGRCNNKKDAAYADYGGRGIKCLFDGPEDMALWLVNHFPRPSKGLVLDRADNNGNYEKGNLRWVTKKQSLNNRRNTVMVTIGGVTRPITEWAEEHGLNANTILGRIKKKLPEALWLRKGDVTISVLAQYEYGELKNGSKPGS